MRQPAAVGEADVVDPGAHALSAPLPPATRPFVGPDPFHELAFPTALAARHTIADEIRLPLAKLGDDDRAFIDRLLAETLSRPVIIAAVRERFSYDHEWLLRMLAHRDCRPTGAPAYPDVA